MPPTFRSEFPLTGSRSYWDHVAGSTLDAALVNFNNEGLIIACGAISQASKGDSGVKVNSHLAIASSPELICPE